MHSLILLHKKNIDHCYHDDELLYNVLFGLNHRVSAYKSVLINNISGNPTNNSFRSSSTQQHNNIIRVSDIQGSIYRISSQACAGESSRSGTANVLRNALIWKFHHWSDFIIDVMFVGIDASDCRMSALYARLPVYTYSDIYVKPVGSNG